MTQKKNIVEGTKLLIDLATGQATVIPTTIPPTARPPCIKAACAPFSSKRARTGTMNPFASTPKKTDASPPQKSRIANRCRAKRELANAKPITA